MAMSKIEQAGVDAKALQGLISANNASGIPEKATNSTKSSSLMPASEPTLKEEKLECVEEEEPVESDCSAKDKPELEAQPEVCNQASEDRQEVEGPANEDDAHPEQESGSDVGDEEEVVDSQDTALPEQDMFVAEVLNTDVPSITDDETLEAIKQVLSDMAAAIKEAETENRLKEERAIPTTLMEPDALNAEMSNLPVVEELVAEPTDSADLENNVETVDETNIEVNVKEEIATPAAESGDSTDPTPVEEVTDAQPITEAVQTAQKPAATEEEELEAKAMAKCTCGRCAIM
ncbi:unnamed protein product [Phytophthora lilii]|uniref:Unnamed protein product n=1 Tax=Phytophthora lilii TaxID=2077276 RepID=A0A9W6UE38_9STRA|nr:unnamed protein product [Phytophthora lilii]